MFVGNSQAQHWMKTPSCESPERVLELQLRNPPANLLYDQSQAIARWLHWTICRAFPKSVDWNKIQTYTQKSDKSAHEYYNWLQNVFKWNSHLPSNVESIWAVFKFLLLLLISFELWCWEDSWESLGLQSDPTSPSWKSSRVTTEKSAC